MVHRSHNTVKDHVHVASHLLQLYSVFTLISLGSLYPKRHSHTHTRSYYTNDVHTRKTHKKIKLKKDIHSKRKQTKYCSSQILNDSNVMCISTRCTWGVDK